MSIFDAFLGTKKKSYVGINICSKSTIEVIEYDTNKMEIKKYHKSPFAYENSAKKVSNPQQLELELQKILQELNISKGRQVVLTLPTVFMTHQTLPADLLEDELKMAVTSETEKNYIFLREEPVVDVEVISENDETATKYVLASAVQKSEVDNLKDIFKSIGYKLLAIDNSIAALLRGLSLTGLISSDIAESKLWCVLLINSNSAATLTLMGSKLIDIIEEPLAIKSFSLDDIYNSILNSSIDTIRAKGPEHLVVISKSDEISAEKLVSQINVDFVIDFIEQNQYQSQDLFHRGYGSDEPQELEEYSKVVNLEAVGTSVWGNTPIGLSFNFLDKKNDDDIAQKVKLMGRDVILSRKQVQNGILGLIGCSILTLGAMYFVLNLLISNAEKEIYSLNNELSKTKNLLSSGGNLSEKTNFIRTTHKSNETIKNAYDDIGSLIPQKLWLDTMDINNEKHIKVSGKSYDVESIMTFYQNLSGSNNFKNIKIASIKVVSTSEQPIRQKSTTYSGLPKPIVPTIVPDKIYQFVINN